MTQQLFHDPDIYQIQVDLPKNPLRYLNAYVIKGKRQNLVIDTGFNQKECYDSLFAGLRELHVDLANTALFLTHLHSDHTGLVGTFAKAGCPIYMGETDYLYMQENDEGKFWKRMKNHFNEEGMPDEDIEDQSANQAWLHRANPNFDAVCVHDGDIIHLAGVDLHVIHTPGHTKGLCCLYLPEQQIFFSSDHILFDITPNITIWGNMDNALKTYLESLDKVHDLPVKLALPGHRKGDTSIAARIDAIKAHHAKRLAEVYHIVQTNGPLTAYEIASCMTWSMRGKQWKDFPPTQKWFAMGECLSHVEYLLAEGKVGITRGQEPGVRSQRMEQDKYKTDYIKTSDFKTYFAK